MMHYTQRRAESIGRNAFAAGATITGNPYRRSTKSFVAFERGFRAAERRSLSAKSPRPRSEAQPSAGKDSA